MTWTEASDQDTERMLLDLVAKITNEVEALQARGESINQLLLTVITVAYETGADSRQPEIDALEETLDAITRSKR